ncbi:MAG: T9SS type A sorting domain-containing protein [Chitinophagaceae bacterium]|nr:T9SS type A sorting domain-containing protein [Chitinophagaceae bacterium]
MKNLYIILLCALSTLNSSAQNLVTNGDFEDSIHCPNNIYGSLVENAAGWMSMRGSPNYFHSCVDDTLGLFDVPSNGFGNQYPSSGNAYGGFYTYGNPAGGSENYREFMGTHLLQPLTIGQTYYVSFKISWATEGIYYPINWATNKVGARFSILPQNSLTSDPLPNSAHIYENSVIADSLNWSQVSNSFIADSNYEYVIFGNFFDAGYTTAISYGPTSLGAYYYIDDVCVTGTKSNCETWNSIGGIEPNISLKLYPNPVDDKLIVEMPQSGVYRLAIFNSQGIVVEQRNDKEIRHDEEFNTKEFENGVYWCGIFSYKRYVFNSFIVHH